MSEIPDIIIKNADQRTLAPKAVAIQVATMTIISAATIIAFNFLRPNNKIIYEPKVKYHVGNKEPPRISDSLLGWLPPLIHTKEPELVDKIGLDAVTFLRFTRMFRWLFTAVAILCCGILIPINAIFNLRNIDSNARDILSMLTIRDVRGNWLYAHIIVSYITCGLVMGAIWYNWREMVRLRNDWFRSPEYINSFYARTLMIQGVPRKFQSDEGIRAIFESVQVPYPTTSVHIGRKVGDLPELIKYHNDTVKQLEEVLVRYLKNGRIASKRPTYRIGGFMGCGGRQVDAIDFYTAKLQKTENAVEQYRNSFDTRKPESYGFASMAAVPYAHIVASMLRNKKPKGTHIILAPNHKDIVWGNLNLTTAEIAGKKTIGWIWLIFVSFLNTAPLFIISILANLASLTAFVPFLSSWDDTSPGSFAFVSGVLPPAVSAIFGFALPIIFRWLSKYQGAQTHSRLDRAVIARYYGFLVSSQLVIFTLIGVVFISVRNIVLQVGEHESFQQIIDNLHTLPDTINQTYIDQSSYWLTYFPLQGFLVIFDLAQLLNLFWITFKKRVFGRTPREIREWTKPPEFQYSIYYSNILFMGTVALVFAPLAPLVAVAAAVVFWLGSWVYKYQLMFVFVSRVETGGRLWNVVANRVLMAIILMQMLMTLTIGLQLGFKTFRWVSTLPPIVLTLIFKGYLGRRFNQSFQHHIPDEQELRAAKVHSQRADTVGDRLGKRFGHPSLAQELFTPMVHANTSHLLPEVYSGKIESAQKKLHEYGGQKIDTQVVQGIKIATVDQRDLEYDLALYQRDRGEQDWDAQSMTSTVLLRDTSTAPSKSMFYADTRSGSPAPSLRGPLPGYERYMAQGTQPEYEMTRFDMNPDQAPLLPSSQLAGYDSRFGQSTSSLGYRPVTPVQPPLVPSITREGGGAREAPIHRPQYSARSASSYRDDANPPNMAGRGAHRA